MKSRIFSPEYKLLLQAVRLDDPAAAVWEAEKIISTGSVDWKELLRRAESHRVRPQLDCLLTCIRTARVPDFVQKRLVAANRENLLRHLRNISEFFQVKEALDLYDITTVPFKGFWLAHEMYGRLEDRESSDIDLFIDLKDIGIIKTSMSVKGFKLQDTLARLKEDYIFRELAEYNFSKFSGETVIIHFEFHWRIGLKAYRMDIKMDDLRSQLIKGSIQEHELTVFTPATNLLLTIMHHGGKDRFMQLRNILDVAKIITKHPDLNWEWLLMQARIFHVETLVYLGVRLASEITGVPMPPLIADRTESRSVKHLVNNRLGVMSGRVDDWFTYQGDLKGWLFRIRSRDGLKTKIQLSWHTLRKVLMPHLIPGKWRHHFFDRKIVLKPAVINEA